MIRIEGIPVVAARLAAKLKSTKPVGTSARIRQQLTRQGVSSRRSTAVRVRLPQPNTQAAA